MKRLGLGIWTLGNHARRNLVPAAIEAPSWELRGVTTRDAALCVSVAAELGVTGYPSPDAMLADERIDAVLLAGPNGTHFDQACRALTAGKHVFVEKSLAGRLSEVEELVTLASSRRRVLAECFMYRFHPQFLALRQIVRSQHVLGRIHTFHARFGFPHLAPTDIRYSRALEGGALLDAGSYCVSALAALMGANVQVAWARLEVPEAFEVDTGGTAVLATETATGHADWGFGRAYRNEIEIWGEEASVSTKRAFSKPATLGTEIAIVHQRDNRLESRAIPAANAFVSMLEHFAHACDSDVEREALLSAALHQARLIDAVRARDGDGKSA